MKTQLRREGVAVSVTPVWPRRVREAVGRAKDVALAAAGWPRRDRPEE
jgi:hypothetical protein